MSCDKIKVKRSSICVGDMTERVDIQKRVALAPSVGSMNPTTVFTTILSPWCALKTIDYSGSSSRRFNNVNISELPTHELFINYDPSIVPLDSDKVFVLLSDGRRLRIVGVTNMNETNTTLNILCTERGLDEASKA